MNSLTEDFLDACETQMNIDTNCLLVEEQDDLVMISMGYTLKDKSYPLTVSLLFYDDCDTFDVYVQRDFPTDDKKQNYSMFFRMNKINKKYRDITCYMDKNILGIKYLTNVDNNLDNVCNITSKFIPLADNLIAEIIGEYNE